jgi:hypothetical protein
MSLSKKHMFDDVQKSYVCQHCGKVIGDGEGIALRGSIEVISKIAKDELEYRMGASIRNHEIYSSPYGNILREFICWRCFVNLLHIPYDKLAKAMLEG